MIQPQPLLDVANLTAHYGHAQVLFGITLTLAPGEVAALVGRNGAGKSTTLKAIMGLMTRKADRVVFDGRDISMAAPHVIARHGLGYVPEERRIFTELTVDENLEVGRQSARGGNPAWTLPRLFEIFPNLSEMRGRQASRMSGGEQQMLTIARTLMGNPSAVLLDEPSEGLAPVIVEQMADAVLAMKREGVAVLISEQNLAFVSRIADRALVIDKGSIRLDAPMREIMTDTNLRDRYLGV